MDLLEQIVARAKSDKQRIVLPEAEEERTLKAADRVLADDIANLILIGNLKCTLLFGLGEDDTLRV